MSTITSPTPPSLRIIQALGITSSAFIIGWTTAVSFALVPRLLESPTPILLTQWHKTYISSGKLGRALAVITSACYFYLAYALHVRDRAGLGASSRARIYAYLSAAALTLGIVPYTLVIMRDNIRKLMDKVEETRVQKTSATASAGTGDDEELVLAGRADETAHWLLDQWGVLNLGRAVMLGAACGIGTWAALA